MPGGLAGAKTPDGHAVLDHVRDDIDLGMAFDETAPGLLDRRHVEIAEAAAEGDEILVAQMLATEQHNLVVEPGLVDRGEGPLVDGAQIDAADFGAERAAGRDDSDAIQATDRISAGSRTFLVGSMPNEHIAPTSRSPAERKNGSSYRPVRWIIHPNTTGEIIPAMPNPVFMIPPAVPAYLPAISSGSVQSTALVSSRKKNASARSHTAHSGVSVNMAGTMKTSAPAWPASSSVRRARPRFPVRLKMASETTPPRVSPTTPARRGRVVMSAIRSGVNPRASDK